MAACLRDTEEKSNGSKLSRLLIDGGTAAQRQVFDRFHPPSTLGASLHSQLPILTHLQHKKILNNNQWDKLFPPSGAAPDSKGFDITLLFVLLRNICGLAPPATGWNNLPLVTDTSLEANLARIKYYRNQVYGHVSSTELSKAEFEHYWKKISGALVALGLDQISIDILKSSPLGTTDYLMLLADWSVSDHTVKEITEETKKEIHKTRQTAEETRKEVNKIRIAAEEAKNAAELIKEETTKTQRAVKESVCKINQLVKKVNDLQQPSQTHTTDYASNNTILSKLFKSNFTGHINFLFNLFHPGTRKWMLDKLWQHLDNERSQCIVVTAQPGIGKSILAAITCKTLQDEGRLAACHFIQHDNYLTNDPRLIIESIAVKMCETIPDFRQKLQESLSRNLGKELSNMNCKELFTILLENPINALAVNHDRKVVVIDALDECDPKQKEDFVKALFCVLPKLPKWIKFVLTTRPITGIVPSLSSVSVIDIEAENENNNQDIKLYLTYQLSALYKDSTLTQVEDAVVRLVGKCGGIFLVAHFVIDCVNDQQTDLGQIHKLFPEGISSVYEEYFKYVVTEIEVEEERFYHFLEAIVAAQNPLPETLVLHILGLNGDSHETRKTARMTLRNLSSLFTVHGGHITVFHKSVFDWLTKDRHNSEHHHFSVKIKDGHHVLAEHCLNYLQDIKGYNSFPPSLNDCERYALTFGLQHMVLAGGYEKQLSECVNSLEILSAQFCASSDERYGMRNLCHQLERVTNVFSSDELFKFVRNLKHFSSVSCRAYPQAVLQAAVCCSFLSNQRKEAVRLLDTPKYNFGYVSPTHRHWDLPGDYTYILSFKVSVSAKIAACIGSTKSRNFFAATFDVDTGNCIALAVQGDLATSFSTLPAQSRTRLSNVFQSGWRPVMCAISADDKYVAIATFFDIELRLVSSLQVKKTFTVDSEPNTCCFLPCDRKLVVGYCDSKVRVWTVGWRTAHLELSGHSKRVTLCTAASRGPVVVTGDECGSVIVWHSFNPPSSIKIIDGGSIWRWNRSTTISSDGSRIAALRHCEKSPYSALEIAIFSSADGKLLATIPTETISSTIKVFIDNVRLLVGAEVKGYVVNTDTGHIQRILFPLVEERCRRYGAFKRLGDHEYVAPVDKKLLSSFKLCNIK